ncbi:MAG: zinc-ribbon domain-containing protein [Thermodesulfobacteriota bacterium]
MIVRCNYCSNIYNIEESKVATSGIWFGCSNCGEVFYLERELNRGKSEARYEEETIDFSDMPDMDPKETKVGDDKESVDLKRDADKEKQIDANYKRDLQKTFNWRELRLDSETEDRQYTYPKLFDDPEEASFEANSDKLETGIADERISPVRKSYSERLDVDREKVLKTNIETPGSSYYEPERGAYMGRKSGGSILKSAFNYFIILLFTLIIIVAVFTILMSLELISSERISGYGNYLRSKLAFTLPKISSDDVVVTGSVGRWVSTRNGLVYLVSGQITNNSSKVVNFVKLKSEFKSAGENIYEQTVYAGNSLSENELKTLPIEDTILKLKRKSGDIDFNDPRRLAGLNYGIKPGESIPFYIVFPSKRRILGLKYDIDVSEFETASHDQE